MKCRCGSEDIVDDPVDGFSVCRQCGNIIDDSKLTNELVFSATGVIGTRVDITGQTMQSNRTRRSTGDRAVVSSALTSLTVRRVRHTGLHDALQQDFR
jgi:hypothetical protein